MDYYNDAFITILGLESGSCVDCQWRDRKLSFHQKDRICVLVDELNQ